MKKYPPPTGRGSRGKPSLAEAMLFASGATTRLGRVEDGTTVSDWDPDEQKRGLSVNLAVVPVEANGHKINVVDAPGYADFSAVLGQLQSNWGQKCVPLQIPVGSQQALKGVVDLLAMKAYVGEKGEQQ